MTAKMNATGASPTQTTIDQMRSIRMGLAMGKFFFLLELDITHEDP